MLRLPAVQQIWSMECLYNNIYLWSSFLTHFPRVENGTINRAHIFMRFSVNMPHPSVQSKLSVNETSYALNAHMATQTEECRMALRATQSTQL
jgi:hypothetical protein